MNQRNQLHAQILCFRILVKNGSIPKPILEAATTKADPSLPQISDAATKPKTARHAEPGQGGPAVDQVLRVHEHEQESAPDPPQLRVIPPPAAQLPVLRQPLPPHLHVVPPTAAQLLNLRQPLVTPVPPRDAQLSVICQPLLAPVPPPSAQLPVSRQALLAPEAHHSLHHDQGYPLDSDPLPPHQETIIQGKHEKRVKQEKDKVENCLTQLKHSESASINHEQLFASTANRLEQLRNESSKAVKTDTYVQEIYELGILNSSPFRDFPPNSDENLYISIMNIGMESAQETLKLLIDLLIPKDKPIDHCGILKVSHMLAVLVSNTNEKNNALATLKSLVLKTCGTTNEGLDQFSKFDICENSRSLRRVKTFLAGVSEEMVKRACVKALEYTLDNLDLRINETENHLTVTFVEVERVDTTHLPTQEKSHPEKLTLFTTEEMLLTSDQNSDLKKHFEDVVTVTLGRIIGEALPEFRWMLKVLPNHHNHPHSETSSTKSEIHTLKPLYLQETKNKDMVEIVVSQQNHFLEIVGKHCDDEQKFKECRSKARLISTPAEIEAAKEANKYLHETVNKFGEFVAHGDLLTRERWMVAHR